MGVWVTRLLVALAVGVAAGMVFGWSFPMILGFVAFSIVASTVRAAWRRQKKEDGLEKVD